jgi:hypothetical protein
MPCSETTPRVNSDSQQHQNDSVPSTINNGIGRTGMNSEYALLNGDLHRQSSITTNPHHIRSISECIRRFDLEACIPKRFRCVRRIECAAIVVVLIDRATKQKPASRLNNKTL